MNPPEGATRQEDQINGEMNPVELSSLTGGGGGGSGSGGEPLFRIKLSYGPSLHDLSVPRDSTFGHLKDVLARQTGLDPADQRLFFRGREKNDSETLGKAGVKDLSKLLLMERPVSKERKVEELKKKEQIFKACQAIAEVRSEVDQLSEKVARLEASVRSGKKVDEKEFIVCTELLMRQLLKLDGIEVEGEAKVQRKNEVKRIQFYVDALDGLKATNSNPFADGSNTVSVSSQWETFDSGMESSARSPVASTKVTQDWEQFD